jgi:hypothetical protein
MALARPCARRSPRCTVHGPAGCVYCESKRPSECLWPYVQVRVAAVNSWRTWSSPPSMSRPWVCGIGARTPSAAKRPRPALTSSSSSHTPLCPQRPPSHRVTQARRRAWSAATHLSATAAPPAPAPAPPLSRNISTARSTLPSVTWPTCPPVRASSAPRHPSRTCRCGRPNPNHIPTVTRTPCPYVPSGSGGRSRRRPPSRP